MTSWRGVAWAACVAIGVAGLPSVGGAQTPAGTFETVGKAAYAKGDYDQALTAFEMAYAKDPQPKHLYNLGRCHERIGEIARAAEYFEAYLKAAPEASDANVVQGKADVLRRQLAKTHGRVAVMSVPAGAALELAGGRRRVDAQTPYWGWVSIGGQTLTLTKDGFERATRHVQIKPDEVTRLTVELVSLEGPPAPAPPPPVEVGARGGRSPGPGLGGAVGPDEPSKLPWVGVGVGIALAAAGVGFLAGSRFDLDRRDDLVASSRKREVRHSEVSDADDAARAKWWGGQALLGAGLVVGAASAVWLYTREEEGSAGPELQAGPSGVGMSWGAAW